MSATTSSRSRWRSPESASERRSSCSRSCAPVAFPWVRWANASSTLSPTSSGSTTRSRSPAARRRSTSACASSAGARATRSSPAPSPSSPPPTPCSTRGRSRSSSTSIPRRSTSIPTPRPPRSREKTAGLLPIDIFGWPAAWPELEALAAKHGLGILEDSCEALGAVDSEGRMVGTRGNFATFAFYANKQMTTGEGGMIVPTDADAAARLRSERNQGRAVDMGWLDHDRLGFNYRLSDVAAAIGLAQVEKLPSLLERRAAVAADLRRAAGGRAGRDGADGGARPRGAQLVRLRRAARRRDRPRRGDRAACASTASTPRTTCRASTSSRTSASSATARASSRSPRPPRPTRWRCRSSRG